MKPIVSKLFSLLLILAPMSATAQSNIQSAFNDIIKCSQAKITESHTLEKDPGTKVKTGQCDIYNFVLPANKIGLIKKVFSAFEKDSNFAYNINRGVYSRSDSRLALAVGDGSGSGVYVNEPHCEYIYMLFLAPEAEDPDGKYRYAYAMNYKEEDKNIIGKLIITYATTLKYRQDINNSKKSSVFRNTSNQSIVTSSDGTIVISSSDSSKQTWFDELMSYLQGITSTSSNLSTKIALASRAYKHVSKINYKVSEADKTTAREILKVCIQDSRNSDPMLNTLLKRCLVELK